MALVRSRKTKPERIVASILRANGVRYRANVAGLPGTPDFRLLAQRKVIFVHGCFWHLHAGCNTYRLPKTRLEFWLPKLRGNKARDALVKRRLTLAGWKYLVVWGCELRDPSRLSLKLRRFAEESDAGD